jgi:hypothetical protein
MTLFLNRDTADHGHLDQASIAPPHRSNSAQLSRRLLAGFAGVVAFAGLVSGCLGSGGATKGAPSTLIVLGTSIGGIQLGERRADVANAL